MTTLAVIGAQYGSEGKGVMVYHLADSFDVHVRVGGPNAGHTFLHKGRTYKMRAVPCGWTNDGATLVIGRGAIINPKVLADEVRMIAAVDPTIWDRLFVDAGAWCIDRNDVLAEEGMQMQEKIGSTLEGVGWARISRITRRPDVNCRFEYVAHHWGLEKLVHPDTAMLLNWFRLSRNILLEGTQGFGLSLLHGEWPYVTSADTNAAQLAADCGLPPNAIDDVLLVMRTYPIRVGGNSGPLPREITWEQLSERLGRDVREYTTVTGRLRRIAEWDDHVIMQARTMNGATRAALMFTDYVDPVVEGRTELTKMVEQYIEAVEQHHHLDVVFAGTGGPDLTVVRRGAWPWP